MNEVGWTDDKTRTVIGVFGALTHRFFVDHPDEEGSCIHRFRFRQFHNPDAASRGFRVPVYDQGLLAEDYHPLVPIPCEIQGC
jgi:hypothetical protein